MSKKTISIRIDSELYNSLSKRADKNYLTVDEMSENIIRRSMISWKGGPSSRRSIKVSKLVAAFSRERRGRKKTKRKKKRR